LETPTARGVGIGGRSLVKRGVRDRPPAPDPVAGSDILLDESGGADFRHLRIGCRINGISDAQTHAVTRPVNRIESETDGQSVRRLRLEEHAVVLALRMAADFGSVEVEA